MALFYVETTGRGHSPVDYKDRAAAEAGYERAVASRDYMRVRLYDCSGGPVGAIIRSTAPGEALAQGGVDNGS